MYQTIDTLNIDLCLYTFPYIHVNSEQKTSPPPLSPCHTQHTILVAPFAPFSRSSSSEFLLRAASSSQKADAPCRTLRRRRRGDSWWTWFVDGRSGGFRTRSVFESFFFSESKGRNDGSFLVRWATENGNIFERRSEVRQGGGGKRGGLICYNTHHQDFIPGLLILRLRLKFFGLCTKNGIDDAQRNWIRGKRVQRQRKSQLIASLSVHWTTDPPITGFIQSSCDANHSTSSRTLPLQKRFKCANR